MTAPNRDQARRYADTLRRYDEAREAVLSGRMTLAEAAKAYRVRPWAIDVTPRPTNGQPS